MKRTLKTLSIVLLLLLSASMVFASGSQEGNEVEDDVITIGLSHINFSHEFFRGWIDEQEIADAHFGTKTIHKSSDGNIEKQISDIEAFISLEVDVVMINPNDVVGLKPVVQSVLDSGIGTMSTANVIEVEGNKNALLAEYQIFSNIAHIMAAKIDFTGNVMWLGGQVGNWASDVRQEGFLDTMETYPDIKVLDVAHGEWDGAKSVAIVEGWLTTYDKIDAIGCMDDGMGLPAWEAIKNAGRDKDIVFSSAYGGQPGYDKVNDGEFLTNTALTPQMFAWFCTNVAYRIAKGYDLDENVLMEVPLVISQDTFDYLVEKDMPGINDLVWITPAEAANLGAKGKELFGLQTIK